MKAARRLMGGLLLVCGVNAAVHGETLQEAWDQALAANQRMVAAEQTRLAAGERTAAAKAARLPTVSVNAGYLGLNHPPTVQTDIANTPVNFNYWEQNSLHYNVLTTLPIYSGGQIGSEIAAAGAQQKAAEVEQANARANLKMAVADAYIGVLRAIGAQQNADSHVASLAGHRQDVANLLGQGMVSRNDLLMAEVALADARQRAIQAANARELALAAYNQLLRRPLDQAATLDEPGAPAVTDSLDQLTAQALSRRAELAMLGHRIDALEGSAEGARAATRPKLSLTGGYNYQENRFQAHEDVWGASLDMTWPVFDGGVARHRSGELMRQAAAAAAERDDLVDGIRLQVRQAWLNLAAIRQRLEVTQHAIAQAEENLAVTKNSYRAGLVTSTQVLDAEGLRASSVANHADAGYDAAIAAIQLQRVIGAL